MDFPHYHFNIILYNLSLAFYISIFLRYNMLTTLNFPTFYLNISPFLFTAFASPHSHYMPHAYQKYVRHM